MSEFKDFFKSHQDKDLRVMLTPLCREKGLQIWRGDCLEALRELPDASVGTVLTDPPYNNGCRYASYDDSRSEQEYADWCEGWFLECQRVANRVIIFPGPWNLKLWSNLARPSGIGCWLKPGTGPVHISNNAFQFVEWEPFLVFGGKRLGGSNVIRAPIGKRNQLVTGQHPCPKPLHLMMEILRKVKDETILDPFMGSGTVGVAAILTGKRFLGIEIDPGYCKTAVSRIQRVLAKRRESIEEQRLKYVEADPEPLLPPGMISDGRGLDLPSSRNGLYNPNDG